MSLKFAKVDIIDVEITVARFKEIEITVARVKEMYAGFRDLYDHPFCLK